MDTQEVFMIRGAGQTIEQTVTSWQGVSAQPHRFGGREFNLETREIGHIHGDKLVDIPFPKKVRDELVNTGEANAHHILPESGWISFYIREEGDVGRAIKLLEKSYKLALEQKARKESTSASQPVSTSKLAD
jgi:predicted DNA-binding protein (MmcQ/YjbR family)